MSEDKKDADHLTASTYGSVSFFAAPLFRCSKHGAITQIISSTIPGHEGRWCQICWLETLARNGVHRVEKIEKEKRDD